MHSHKRHNKCDSPKHSHKHKKYDEELSQAGIQKSLEATLGELMKLENSSKKEICELFQILDDGFEIDLSGLEDEHSKRCLYKIMKLLRLQKNGANKYKFTKPISLKECLLARIKANIEHIKPETKVKGQTKIQEKDELKADNSLLGIPKNDDIIGPQLPPELSSKADNYIEELFAQNMEVKGEIGKPKRLQGNVII